MLMALHLNRLVGYFLLVVIFSRIVSKKFHIHVGTRTFRCAGNKRAEKELSKSLYNYQDQRGRHGMEKVLVYLNGCPTGSFEIE